MIGKYIHLLKIYWKETPVYVRIIFSASVLIAAFLVWKGLGNVVFTYDQARDALQAYSIWHDHHLKILGPGTDIPGVFHGVLWYYILAFLYGLGHVPEFVVIVFCGITLATGIIVGILSQKLFQSRTITLTAISFYIVSPLFQTTSHWISNPLVSFLVTPLLLLFLWKYINKGSAFLAFGIGVCFGVIVQSEFAFLFLLLSLPLYWLVFRFRLKIKDISSLLVGLGITLFTFLIAEIKFKGQGIKGMIAFFHGGSSPHTLADALTFFFTRIIDYFTISFFPMPVVVVALILLILAIFFIRFLDKTNKKPVAFLLVWIAVLSLFLIFRLGISRSYFLFLPFLAPLILLVSFAIVTLCKKKQVLSAVICLCILAQAVSSYSYITSNTSPLPAQQGATLSLAKQTMEYTYATSSGKPFTIVTITNPLYINSTWAYLYTEYGLREHGYVPYFAGRGQADDLGYLPEKQFATAIRYLIIEPKGGIPDVYVAKITYEEDKVSDIISQAHFGKYIVQKRRFHNNKPTPMLPVLLKNNTF